MRRKIISALMLFAMVGAAVCACNKDNPTETNLVSGEQEAEVAEAAKTYYGMRTFNADDVIDGNPGQWAGPQKVLYGDDECFVVIESYCIGLPDELEEAQGEDNDVYRVRKYSIREDDFGAVLGEFDLGEILSIVSDESSEMTSSMVSSLMISEDGNLVVLTQTLDYTDYSTTNKAYFVDFETGELLSEPVDIALDTGIYGFDWFVSPIEHDNGMTFVTARSATAPAIKLFILNDEFEIDREIEITDFGDSGIIGITSIRAVGNNSFLISGHDYEYEDVAFIYDVEAETLTETSFVDYWNYSCFADGGVYGVDDFGIIFLSFENSESEQIVDFNNGILDRNLVGSSLAILSKTSNGFVGVQMSIEYGYTYVLLEETETNPFEGKTELKLAIMSDYVLSGINTAIYLYNLNSTDSYITIDTRYLLSRYLDENTDIDYNESLSSYRESAAFQEGVRQGEAYVTNQMAIDIMSGDGPDIIINGYEYSQFNTSNVMVDLNALIDGDPEFHREDYFDAVFATTTDGLYQVPYFVDILAIEDVEGAAEYRNDSCGVTLEDYRAYVSEFCNGVDPLIADNLVREEYFLFLFNMSRNLFFSGNEIDIDNENFYEIAEFCAELPEITMDYDEYHNWLWQSGNQPTAWFSDYGGVALYDGRIILAVPSPDGSPAQFRSRGSVGITNACEDVDAAWEFVRILFSDEIQASHLYSGTVNREIFRTSREQIVEINNEEAENYYDPTDPSYVPPRYADTMVDELMNAYEAATTVYTYDSDIDLVLYEEIQAYFAGDKTLDQVIEIIEDRCQTILDERG